MKTQFWLESDSQEFVMEGKILYWGHPTLGEMVHTLLWDLMRQVTRLIPVLLISWEKISNMKNSFASPSEEETH